MKITITLIAFVLLASCLVVVIAQVGDDDCFGVLFELGECLTYLTEGSKMTNSAKWLCCGEFMTVMKGSQDCICYVVKNSEKIGLDLRMARADALLSMCHVPVHSAHLCEAKPSSKHDEPLAPSPKSAPPPNNKSHEKSPAPIVASSANSAMIFTSVAFALQLLLSFYLLV